MLIFLLDGNVYVIRVHNFLNPEAYEAEFSLTSKEKMFKCQFKNTYSNTGYAEDDEQKIIQEDDLKCFLLKNIEN